MTSDFWISGDMLIHLTQTTHYSAPRCTYSGINYFFMPKSDATVLCTWRLNVGILNNKAAVEQIKWKLKST